MKQVTFSDNFRRHAVQKMFSRGQQSIDDLARELGCSTPSLYKWSKSMKLSTVPKHISKWTTLERCHFISQFSALPEQEKGVWLRSNGLTSELIQSWIDAITAAGPENPHQAGMGKLRKELKSLEHQLRRKDDKLRQSAAIINASPAALKKKSWSSSRTNRQSHKH